MPASSLRRAAEGVSTQHVGVQRPSRQLARRISRYAPLLVLMLAADVGRAQTAPLIERGQLTSSALNEPREYLVRLPRAYSRTTQRYHVVYVLDADALFLTTAAAAQVLEEADAMPPTIIVGIQNTDRERDFTTPPTHPEAVPKGVGKTGGVARFTTFLTHELIPEIDRRFRTAPSRTLIGHSLGGLAAMHVLTTQPTSFRGYVTLEPSLWWDRRAAVDSLVHALPASPAAIWRLVAVERGSDDGWRPDSARLLASLTSRQSVQFVHVAGVSHQQLPYRGIYDGLRTLFSGYPSEAIGAPDKATIAALEAQYATLSAQFGYPIDVPVAALLDAARRRLETRNARDAVALLEYAAGRYPRDARIATQLAAARREAAAPLSPSAVAFVPVSAQAAAQLVGEWEESAPAIGSAPPQRIRHTFSLRGDSLMHAAVAYVSADTSQKFAIAPMPVAVHGDTIAWERVNRAGGGYITRLVRASTDELIGEERGLGLPAPPPGVVNRPVPVRLRRVGAASARGAGISTSPVRGLPSTTRAPSQR